MQKYNDEIAKRIQEVIDYSGMGIIDFSKALNIPQTTIYSQLSGYRSVNVATIQKILIAFPEIEERWLILGEDQMLSRKSQVAQKRRQ